MSSFTANISLVKYTILWGDFSDAFIKIFWQKKLNLIYNWLWWSNYGCFTEILGDVDVVLVNIGSTEATF